MIQPIFSMLSINRPKRFQNCSSKHPVSSLASFYLALSKHSAYLSRFEFPHPWRSKNRHYQPCSKSNSALRVRRESYRHSCNAMSHHGRSGTELSDTHMPVRCLLRWGRPPCSVTPSRRITPSQVFAGEARLTNPWSPRVATGQILNGDSLSGAEQSNLSEVRGRGRGS